MRATQSVKEQFKAELDRVAQGENRNRAGFSGAKTEWEQEKLKMVGEAVKLRRAAQIMGHAVPRGDSPEVNPKVRAIEAQLKESVDRWNSEREKFVGRNSKAGEFGQTMGHRTPPVE